MTTVRAARLAHHGAPLHLEDVELPEPGTGEVFVRLSHAGVNPVDRYTAAGRVAPDGPLPRTLGSEAAGRLADGTAVLVSGGGLGATRDGLWAGGAIVPERAALPAPPGLTPPELASMGVAGLTAWRAVVVHGEVGAGDRVLVLGAGGGVGLANVHLAVARGASVWGQVGTASKADAVRAAGAGNVVTADADGLAGALRDFAPTVVLDPLGGGFAPVAVAAIAPHGRYVIFGTSAGAEVTLDWQQVYRKGLSVHGLSNHLLSLDERFDLLTAALSAAAAGDLRLTVDRVVPLAEVNAACSALGDRTVTGNVVLDLGTSG